MYKIFVDDKLICISNQRAYEAFCREFREVNAAGGLVCRPLSQEEIGSQHPDGKVCSTNDGARYLFIQRKGLWDLPKGHQEPGEDIRTTALREVSEETGIPLGQLRIRPSAEEPDGLICITDHCYIRDGLWHLKHTWWYAMELTENISLAPQLEEDISAATWVSPQDIPALLTHAYSSIPEVFRHAAPQLARPTE